MKYCVGIDLGSTTTKAVVVDEAGHVLGRGITNSRSSYDAACQVAVPPATVRLPAIAVPAEFRFRLPALTVVVPV